MQILPTELDDKFKLSVALEYSQEETLTMFLKYNGKLFDVRNSDNSLALMIAKNASESIDYEQISENDDFINHVTVKIK